MRTFRMTMFFTWNTGNTRLSQHTCEHYSASLCRGQIWGTSPRWNNNWIVPQVFSQLFAQRAILPTLPPRPITFPEGSPCTRATSRDRDDDNDTDTQKGQPISVNGLETRYCWDKIRQWNELNEFGRPGRFQTVNQRTKSVAGFFFAHKSGIPSVQVCFTGLANLSSTFSSISHSDGNLSGNFHDCNITASGVFPTTRSPSLLVSRARCCCCRECELAFHCHPTPFSLLLSWSIHYCFFQRCLWHFQFCLIWTSHQFHLPIFSWSSHSCVGFVFHAWIQGSIPLLSQPIFLKECDSHR